MNFQYTTGLQNAPPVPADMRSSALRGLIPQMPVYGENFADNARSLGAANMAAYNINADKANAEYDLRQRAEEQQLVNQGLNMLANQRQQERDLRLSKLSAVNSLLGGLFT